MSKQTPAEIAEQLAAFFRAWPSLDGMLAEMESFCGALLAEAGADPPDYEPSATWIKRFAKRHARSGSPQRMLNDAVKVARMVDDLRQHLANDRPRDATWLALQLGMAWEAMRFRRHEADAQAGNASSQGAAEHAAETEESRRAQHAAMQAAIDAAMRRNGKVSYSQACESLARQMRVSAKTIKRNTTNPRPGKKRK